MQLSAGTNSSQWAEAVAPRRATQGPPSAGTGEEEQQGSDEVLSIKHMGVSDMHVTRMTQRCRRQTDI